MEIRRAEIKDIERILTLLEQVLKVHAQIRPDLFNDIGTKYNYDELRAKIRDDSNSIFVAVIDNNVVGYIFCNVLITTESHHLKRTKTFYIDDLCVDKDYRRMHIGESLLERAIKEAKLLGCDDVTLNIWQGNDEAMKFYEKHGFKVRSSIMEISLK